MPSGAAFCPQCGTKVGAVPKGIPVETAAAWAEQFARMNLRRSLDEKLYAFDKPDRRSGDFKELLREAAFFPMDGPEDQDPETQDPVILLAPVAGNPNDYNCENVTIGGRRFPPFFSVGGGIHVFLLITRTRFAVADTTLREMHQFPLGAVSSCECKSSGEIKLKLLDKQEIKIKFKTPGSKLASFAWNVTAMGFEMYEDTRAEKSRARKDQYYRDVNNRVGTQKGNAIGFMEVFEEFFRLCTYLPEPEQLPLLTEFRSPLVPPIPSAAPAQPRRDPFAKR